MSLVSPLFPPANREAAVSAFLRTFWQVIRPAVGLGGGGAVAISASGLAYISWPTLGYGLAAIVLSAVFSGMLAGGDILTNGLPAAYVSNVGALTAVPAVVPVATATLSPDYLAALAAPAPVVAPVAMPAYVAPAYVAPVASVTVPDAFSALIAPVPANTVTPDPAPVPVGA